MKKMNNVKVFTTSGAWVKPPSLKVIEVTAIRAGGGGALRSADDNASSFKSVLIAPGGAGGGSGV